MGSKIEERRSRDLANGQYAFEIERLCKCGHTLGDHTAARHQGKQPCIIGDFTIFSCSCEAFTPAKRAR